jgi:transcriptional regulator with XRE-family HTH domain
MREKQYDPKRLRRYLDELLAARGLNMRQASLAAGLNQGAVSQMRSGRRPHRDSLLLLAEALEVPPNELLAAAGFEPLPVIDRTLIDPHDLPADVKAFAADLARLDSERRRVVIKAVRALLAPELD